MTKAEQLKAGLITKFGTIRPKLDFDENNVDSRSCTEEHHQTDINHMVKVNPNLTALKRRGSEIDLAKELADMANYTPDEEFAVTATRVREIEEKFLKNVHADIRGQFGNNAYAFAKAYADPNNDEKFYKLGLKSRPVVKLPEGHESTKPKTPAAEPKPPAA